MTTQTHAEPAVERVRPPRWLISHMVNPVARRMLRKKGRMGQEVLLLRYRGRKTGRPYEVPVSYRRIDGRLALFTNSAWRYNFRGGRDVQLVLNGEVVYARASLEDEADQVASVYARLVDELGVKGASRRLGIKVHVDRKPTREELAEMARASRLSVVWLDLRNPATVRATSGPSALSGRCRPN